jgi:hypothetical protein
MAPLGHFHPQFVTVGRELEGVPDCWYPAWVDDSTVSLECGNVVFGVEFPSDIVCALLAVASQSCGAGDCWCQGLYPCEETSSRVGSDQLHKVQVPSPPPGVYPMIALGTAPSMIWMR